MPTLDWIGKNKVINHHLDVPFCILERQYSFDASGKQESGLDMFSRFWMGRPIKVKPLRKIMTDDMVRGMAEHCCIEYRNLAEILPGLYKEYGNR